MKKYIVTIVLTLVTGLVVFFVREADPIKNERLFEFPMKIGDWSGQEIKMEDWVFESLETKYAILRNYRSKDGEVVNLAITWYDDKEVAFHAPEACLGGVGNKVKELTSERMRIGDAGEYQIGRILAERSGVRLFVFYYFINDGYVTPDQTELRKRILLRRVGFKRTSAAFVRVMMPVRVNDQHSRDVLMEFMRVVFPITLEYTDTEKIRR